VLSNDTDPDGDALNAVLVSNVSHGTLTLNSDGSFSYTPATDFKRPGQLQLQGQRWNFDSAVTVVSITVIGTIANKPPSLTWRPIPIGRSPTRSGRRSVAN